MRKQILIVPLLIVVLSILAVVLLVCQCWIYSGCSFLLAIIFNVWSQTFPIHITHNRLKETKTLRILTYNVNRAHPLSKNEGTSNDLIHFVERHDPDIILLQEYNYLLYPEVREKLSSVFPYGLASECKNNRFKTVFSKYPIENYEQLWVLPNDQRFEILQHAWYSRVREGEREILPVCSMVVKVGVHNIRIINCHLMSNNFSVVIRNLKKKGKNYFYGILSIMARMDYGYSVRKLQADLVADYLTVCNEDAFIVCGDFNDISGSSTLRSFSKIGLRNAWWDKGCGFGFTFHGMRLRLRLDHVLYTGASLRLYKVFVPHSKCSDHYPVVCDFNLI